MLLPAVLILSGCASNLVPISKNYMGSRDKVYFEQAALQSDDLSSKTISYLKNNFSGTGADDNPEAVIRALLTELEIQGYNKDLLEILSDLCWNHAQDFYSTEDAIPYVMATAYYSYQSLFPENQEETEMLSPYDPSSCQTLLRYNRACAFLFRYLNERNLLDKDSYRLPFLEGYSIVFTKPSFQLPVPVETLKKLEICSDYKLQNPEDVSLSFGIGVPLIARAHPEEKPNQTVKYPPEFALPATMYLQFEKEKSSQDPHVLIRTQIILRDSSTSDSVQIHGHQVPLAKDLSTPFALQSNLQQDSGTLLYMFNPASGKHVSGIYLMEPYQPDKIPVVLIHGLMSSPETWNKMVFQFQNDPEIQRNYQFFFYKYSSGNPIIESAAAFRNNLDALKRELAVTPQAQESFQHMVLIGHSMGGLIARTMVQANEKFLLESSSGLPWEELQEQLSEEERAFARQYLFPHPSYISRVIFIACPHRGSEKAQWGVSRLAARLIKLPGNILNDSIYFMKSITGRNSDQYTNWKELGNTGIDNLDPEHFFIQTLQDSPIASIPYHSIIGNTASPNIPGGSDSIVDYLSAHLDGAQSETVVKSFHSVQQTLPGIQEVKRILHLHLNEIAKSKECR